MLSVFALLAMAQPASIPIQEALVVQGVARGGRVPFGTDAIQKLIVEGDWQPPKAGDSVVVGNGQVRKWALLKADKDGAINPENAGGAYAYATVKNAKERVAILEAAGHSMVYVNGEPRMGDPYGYGYVKLPILLKQGVNEFLFGLSRGAIHAAITEPKSEAMFNLGDVTTPDVIAGERDETFGGVIVLNATTQPTRAMRIYAVLPGRAPKATDVPTIPPLSMRKVRFNFAPTGKEKEGPLKVTLRLQVNGKTTDEGTVDLRVRKPGQPYKRTFESKIDGSVQYYGVNPSTTKGLGQALFLSLHGASVEGIGQAEAYEPKNWVNLVAPTNRRPYGFDWEDWGRLDAMEVLDQAKKLFQPDPTRIYLTGHSMGGHGTWQIGVLFPDTFAAIGPSAGWSSFYSYGGKPRPEKPSRAEEMFERASLSSDTLVFKQNYAMPGVYILHGDVDDNVPITEARMMRDSLAGIQPDLKMFEQKGASHWWDASPEPGADCVDWAPMQDFFAKHRLTPVSEMRQVEFTTPSPAVSNRCFWATIRQQVQEFKPSKVKLQWDPGLRKFSGTTDNVATLDLDTSFVTPGKLTIEIDGKALAVDVPAKGLAVVRVSKNGGAWDQRAESAYTSGERLDKASGSFKNAFDNRFVLVYGTHGSAEENAWAFAKARFDAEQWWYRGNGAADVVADDDLKALLGSSHDRSVILYGNADANGAWKDLLQDSPLQVRRAGARMNDLEAMRDDVGCLFVFHSDRAIVAAVAPTGARGRRLLDRMPYFVSGVSYPDWTIAAPDVLAKGANGIVGAGFFDNSWRYSPENSVWP